MSSCSGLLTCRITSKGGNSYSKKGDVSFDVMDGNVVVATVGVIVIAADDEAGDEISLRKAAASCVLSASCPSCHSCALADGAAAARRNSARSIRVVAIVMIESLGGVVVVVVL